MDVPLNLYKLSNPIIGEVVETRSLTPEDYVLSQQVRHLVVRLKNKMPYLPGQSVGVLLPGLDPTTKKPHKPRLYSIASARKGDLGDGQTISLCVVRHFWRDPKTGEINIPGLISNYLCDIKVGETLRLTGPVGRHFLLPEDFQNRDLIFAATGTGIAPFRGMIQEIFESDFKGRAWLYFGVKHQAGVLYDDEFRSYEKHKNFYYVKALSREEKNPFPEAVPTPGERAYVQVKMYQDRSVLAGALSKPDSLLFICGLKGMEQGIFPILEKISSVEKLKAERRLHVEVY